MRPFTPVIQVTVNGREVSGFFYARLIRATVRDDSGKKADQVTVELDDRGAEIALPQEGATLTVALGFKETQIVQMGSFKLQSVALKGGPEGRRMVLQAKAADLKEKKSPKEAGGEHFEDKTLGEIVREVAGRHGLQPVVAPELASIRIDYVMRHGQGALDFLTRLADRFGAVAKPADGKLVFAKKGEAKSATGKALAPILVAPLDCKSWEITSQPRPNYGKVTAPWIDPKTGKRMIEQVTTGLDGPIHMLKHAFATKDEAKKAADAEKLRLNRNTGNGHFEIFGRPSAQAEADVIARGFRDGIDGTWRAEAVEHVFEAGAGGGYTTKVEVKAPGSGKKGKGK